MKFDTFRNSQMLQEFNDNKRLQWLILVIVAILCASGIKALSDKNEALAEETKTQLRLLTRLKAASLVELSTEQVDEIEVAAQQVLSTIPDAPSVSVAEANALSKIDQIVSNLQRGRSSLVGTEVFSVSGNTIWEVRVEVQGQLDEQYLSAFLKKVDGRDPTLRVVSLRYRPSNRGAFATVVDFIFKQAK